MAIATAPAQTSYDEWHTRRWRLTSLAFALLWLVSAVAVLVAGEKRSDLNTLLSAVGEGSVTQVEIVGLPPDPDWRGRTQVTLTWRGTVLQRYAEVVVDTRRRPGSYEGDRVVGDPADYLRSGAPRQELDVTYTEYASFQEWHGWRAPDVAMFLGLATWLGTVLLAGNGPEPWRATKWAWTWVTLIGGPIGCLAFFLLGGPLGLWRPRDVNRRLSGGWAFLLATVFLGGANGA